ncbi:stalk domain-containing protein [Gorillibacterium massiliense]|uniref:stalk domain-containing protein n=1 Tax=Gorillibacterium massiliense TaxID=1280390 RepID=UPI0004B06EF2|nr:stalk domain-containing protein [Gorillibacterium massiliense]
MKKKLLTSFVICSLVAALLPVIANGQSAPNKWYYSTVDSQLTDFEKGTHWIEKMTYENGATTSITEVDQGRVTFLMINNDFIPNADVKINHGYAFVPIRLVMDALGGQVNWDAQKQEAIIVYKSNKMILRAGGTSADLNGKTIRLPLAAQIIRGRMYAPLRAVSEALGMKVSNNIGFMPFFNPLISIDDRTQNVTKEQAVKLAKDAMEHAYDTFSKNDTYANGSDLSNKTLADIKQKIDHIGYEDESAGYWILTGPYEILVDKSTGNMLFRDTGMEVSGSYIEGIFPVDVKNKEIFARGYFLG